MWPRRQGRGCPCTIHQGWLKTVVGQACQRGSCWCKATYTQQGNTSRPPGGQARALCHEQTHWPRGGRLRCSAEEIPNKPWGTFQLKVTTEALWALWDQEMVKDSEELGIKQVGVLLPTNFWKSHCLEGGNWQVCNRGGWWCASLGGACLLPSNVGASN